MRTVWGLVPLVLPLSAQAQFDFTMNDGTITITKYTGASAAVSIPSTINDLRVTGIGKLAFYHNPTLTEVTIPSGVTYIGDYSFSGCPRLTNVTIPSSVTSIGAWAFGDCYKLISVLMSDGVTNIGPHAFTECLSLTNVTIPSSVTYIGDFAFSGCGMTNVTLANGITHIGDYAFSRCGLTSVTIPNSVSTIVRGMFYDCANLTSVVIPNSVVSIEAEAFGKCGLTNVTIPNGVTTIGSSAFRECPSLISVKIPNSVTHLDASSFGLCQNLTAIAVEALNPNYSSIDGVLFNKNQTTLISCPMGKVGRYTVPGSVQIIQPGAFFNCSNLNSITIPNSVTQIGQSAFSWCVNLTRLYFHGNAPMLVGEEWFAFVPRATVHFLPGTTGWGTTFGNLPTAALGVLQSPLILKDDPRFGVRQNEFGFTIHWATNRSVVVEACTDLSNPVWLVLQTNTLVSGLSYFSDPLWANYPGRFYRIRSP